MQLNLSNFAFLFVFSLNSLAAFYLHHILPTSHYMNILRAHNNATMWSELKRSKSYTYYDFKQKHENTKVVNEIAIFLLKKMYN